MSALTAKQEAFCQAIVSGMSQADAYRASFSAGKMKNETIHQEASRLMADRNVAARVAELRKPVIEKLRYGLEQAMREAEEAYTVSKAKENGGAMVAAVTLRAKLNGLLVEKKEIRTGTIEEMGDDALQRFIERKAAEIGKTVH